MPTDSFLVASLGDGKISIVDIFVSFLPVRFLIGSSSGLVLDLVGPLQSGLSNVSPSILILLCFLICCFSFCLYSMTYSPSSTYPVGLLEAPAVRAVPLPCFIGGYDIRAQVFASGLTFLLGVLSGFGGISCSSSSVSTWKLHVPLRRR